ncbi:acetoacetate decarboxylase [Seinonella peptonophila]|uniref:Acetoacetate decarboxylase n=1 Tax=Seinonella peptonophila TaxID=112248 RepID=A0A1M4SKR8_9BACL|nr:acetoacetate decarboxylase family protein [Seinonella peptonophila]SHE32577.1 acetoacetate decarboxylase [Seinonella peptonophila]
MNRGNNMPVQAPLIPDPFVPYECMNNRTLFALCQGDRTIIERFLEPTPFEYVDNQFVVSISDFRNCNKVPYMDCAIVIPVKYKDQLGGYYLFEYEDHDAAIAAGRDLWGYPKKFATIQLSKENDQGMIRGTASREGQVIMEIECDCSQPSEQLSLPQITPHLNLQVFPRPDGPGIESMRVISRDTSPDFKKKSEKFGKTKVTLQGLSTDPLNLLQPSYVIGGGITVGDFYATDENGWGKILDTLI